MSRIRRQQSFAILASLFATLAAPAIGRAETITLLKATAGGATVQAGGGITQNADNVVTPGTYEAHARTTVLDGALTGGVSARTSDADQLAVASAHAENVWRCVEQNCADLGIFQRPMFARVSFDGVLDPLMLTAPDATTTEEASLELWFQYQFPGGTFEFRACYEVGTPFDRAESGCATFFEASLTDATGQHDLTDRLVFGPGNAVSFDYAVPWGLGANNWIDSYDIRATVDSTNSTGPHALDFLNTFSVRQTSLDPAFSFATGSGLTTAAVPPVGQVPEAASLALMGTGLLAVARRRRRRSPAISA